MRTLVAAVAAVFIANGPAQAGEPGFYFGGFAGAGSGQSTGTQTSLPGYASSSFGANAPQPRFAPSLSLVLGRDWRLGQRITAGLEAEAGWVDARGDWGAQNSYANVGRYGGEYFDTSATALWTLPFQAALRARAAVALTPELSFYAGVGPAIGYARLQSTLVEHDYGFFLPNSSYDNISASAMSRSIWTPGLSLDAGLAASLAYGFEFRGDYSLSVFRPVSLSIGASADSSLTGALKVSPLVQGLRLGVVRRF